MSKITVSVKCFRISTSSKIDAKPACHSAGVFYSSLRKLSELRFQYHNQGWKGDTCVMSGTIEDDNQIPGMADDSRQHDLVGSSATFPTDSENYSSSHNDLSPSRPSSSESPMILYQPPTIWGLLRGAAINILLPFVNGLMLGFGELLAHEAAFRLGWSGTKVRD